MSNVDQNKFACFFLSLLTVGIKRFFSVPQGYEQLITAFGKCIRTARPGLGSCWSWWGIYQKPFRLVMIKEQVKDYKGEEVFTRDGVRGTINVVVYFTITDAAQAIFAIDDYEEAIKQLVRAALRNECGDLPAMQLLAGRRKLIENLRKTLGTDTQPWGISVRLVEVTEITLHDQQ